MTLALAKPVLIAPKGCTGMTVLERAQRYLSKCPPAISGEQGHKTTFRVACKLVHGFALSAEEALGLLRVWNQTCQPPWSEAELRHKVVSAMASNSGKSRGYLLQGSGSGCRAAVARRQANARWPATAVSVAAGPAKAVFVPEILRRVAALTPNVDAAFVKERSPLCPETQTPASFLHRLYRPGECVVVLERRDSQGVIVERTEPPYDAGCLDYLVNGRQNGVLFLFNPVDGRFHPNPREGGKPSCRSEEAVVAWRYLLLESDEATAREWLAALVQMPLRIAAIYSSGRRSIHALVQVDASSKAEWDEMAAQLKPYIMVLGGDHKAMKAVQLSRLPGCYREQEGPPGPKRPVTRKRWVDEPLEFDEAGDPIWRPPVRADELPTNLWTGGQLQELFYLNPNPDLTPIWKRVTRREVHEKWLAGFRT
jgi:hypothetical protein